MNPDSFSEDLDSLQKQGISSNSDFIYTDLNPAQKKATQNFYGPSLILAGAGSGKTRVIVHRIAALVVEKKVPLENILAVTFTNKAAKEMKERTGELLKKAGLFMSYTPWIGTFHSICAHIIKNNLHLFPKRDSFTIYDERDQLQLIKKILKDLNIDERMHPAKNFRNHINLCKRSAVAPHELHHISFLAQDKKFFTVYDTYEKTLVQLSAFDFGSLLFETYKLMRKNKDFLNQLNKQFQFLFVDEYQDTNYIQYLLIKKLGKIHQNVCVVGDEDQSIYGWRGADISHILNFERDFKECRIFFLEHNYRSTQNIVQAASSLIANNQRRKGKTLFTKNTEGEKIFVKETFNEQEESYFISQKIRELHGQGKAQWKHFCILYRTNAQSRSLEDGLRFLKIPYKIVGNVRFYERAEIKDAISYLKVILNVHDDVSLLRVINTPRRGIGKTTLDKISKKAHLHHLSFYSALQKEIESGNLKGKIAREIKTFLTAIEELKEGVSHIPLYELYISMLEKTGYLKSLRMDQSLENQGRIENLQELGNVIQQKSSSFSLSLSSFLEEMSLLSESDKTKDITNAVTLMTLHNSKGLEFPSVFITGLEEGLFPSFKSIEEGDLEEERRLAYVGITRAKTNLTFTFARSRTVWGKSHYNDPSRFLTEIPEDLVYWLE